MRCPHCQSDTKENPCSNCGKNVYEIVKQEQDFNNNSEQNQEDVLEPEIVNENEYNNKSTWNNDSKTYSSYSGQNGSSFRQYTFINPQFHMRNSCLPSIVSLILFIMVFFEYGFLAAIGFGFFLVLGKSISMLILMKNILNGKFVPPILLDCAVWIISFYLVSWLSE